MKTGNMRDQQVLAGQYKDSSNLDLRMNFHKKYSTNPLKYTDWILSKIKFFNDCRILELGCGTGNLWEDHPEWVDACSELVLTDVSQGMLDIVRKHYEGKKNIRIQKMDILEMPFDDNSFDIVVANSMLYHVDDVDKALENIRRVLRDRGAFYATTFGRNGQLSYIRNALFEMGLADSNEIEPVSFALENGRDILRVHFSTVGEETYDAHLEVSETMDLVNYIFSMSSMSHIDKSNRNKMEAYFESKKDPRGILTIPMMYGMFISVK